MKIHEKRANRPQRIILFYCVYFFDEIDVLLPNVTTEKYSS